MRAKLGHAVLFLALVVGGWLIPSQAQAASVKSVQSGTTSISGPTNTVTVTITAVDTSKSFLIFNTRHNSNRPVASMVRGRIATATSLEFVKVSDEAAGAGVVNIQWYVVEFEGGVRVQRGSVAQSATTVDVGITAVAALSQAFVTWSKTPASTDGNWNYDDPIVCELTTVSNLQCRVNTAASTHTIWWEVVEFTDPASVNVQKGATSLTAGALSTTVTLGTAVDVTKTFVLASYRTPGGGADVGSRMLRAQLTDSTTITFDRDIAGDADDLSEIVWQAVELKDGSSVQRGSQNFASGGAQALVSITSVDTSRSVAFGSVQPVGGQNMGKSPYAGDDIIGVGSVTTALSSTQITMDRNSTAAAADVGWFVVQFFKCAAVADAGYVAANAQSTQATGYWSSSNPVLILRQAGAAFGTERPENGKSYAVGATGGELGTATVVDNDTVAKASFTQTALTNGTTYYYKVFPKTGSGGASCYSPGIEVNAKPQAAPPSWSYMMAGGSMLKPGIAGEGTIYTSSNASRIISLSTANGTQSWDPLAANAAVQGWLTWLPVSGGGGIKSVQTGNVTMSTATMTVGAAEGYAGVTNLSKSFVVCSSRTNSSNPTNRVTCELSATTITITGSVANTSEVVQWYVAEFNSGVSVQRGTATFTTSGAATDTLINVTLPTAVNLSKSFVLISERMNSTSTSIDERWTTQARLTSSTNLELSRNEATTGTTVAWQVVQMAGASVQRGTLCIGASGTCPLGAGGTAGLSNTATLGTAVDTSKSFVLITRKAGTAVGGIEAEYQVRADFTTYGTSVTGLTFSRTTTVTTSNHQVNIAWEVVSLSDGTTVQRGSSSTSATTDTTITPALSPSVDTSRSVPFISLSGGSGTATANLDETSWTAVVTSTALTLQRVGTGTNATIAWQVVEFAAQASPMNVIGGDQSGRVYLVDTGLGTADWQVTLTGADAVQAAVSAQVWDWSDVNFQGTYSDHVIFAATRNTTIANCGTATTNNKVFAIRASDGQVLWTFNGTCTDGSVDYIVGQPWVDYGRNYLYVASRGAGGSQPSLWVINTLSGGLVASFALVDVETSPTMSFTSGALYVGNTSGLLYAIDLNTLALKWSSPFVIGSAVNGFVWEDGATPGRLYMTTADGNVRCVQDNGTSASACSGWTLSNVAGASTPLPLESKLFVGSSDGTVHQINLTNGLDEKQFPAAGTLDGTTVGDVSTETGNEIFVGTNGGKIFKIDLVGGALP